MDDMKPIIEMIQGQLESQIEGEVYRAVQHVGINVDKERLLQALKDARAFWQEGYEAGRRGKPAWISVEERLPEDLPENDGRKVIPCIVALKSCYPNGKATIQKRQRQVTYDYDYNPNGWEWSRIGKSRVTHWMPLPDAPEGDA